MAELLYNIVCIFILEKILISYTQGRKVIDFNVNFFIMVGKDDG